MVYCTLFNSNYLDRGLVMINSLKTADSNSKIYVLCMDNLCFEILNSISIKNVTLISLQQFEDQDLLQIKSTRTEAEYCWSCTSKLILYVIEKYDVDMCTYIDADMRFYSSPEPLFEEMISDNCTVQVIPHRFPDNLRGRRRAERSGRNCVQFNTFTTEKRSVELLREWICQCLGECSLDNVGDQKYTDAWTEKNFVNVSKNGGAGVAPWNSTRYILCDWDNKIIRDRYINKEFKLIFYHFQNLTFPNDDVATIEPLFQYWRIDKKLIMLLYEEYIQELIAARTYLQKEFGFSPIIKKYVNEQIKRNKNYFDVMKDILTIPMFDKWERMDNKIRRKIRKKIALYTIRRT